MSTTSTPSTANPASTGTNKSRRNTKRNRPDNDTSISASKKARASQDTPSVATPSPTAPPGYSGPGEKPAAPLANSWNEIEDKGLAPVFLTATDLFLINWDSSDMRAMITDFMKNKDGKIKVAAAFTGKYKSAKKAERIIEAVNAILAPEANAPQISTDDIEDLNPGSPWYVVNVKKSRFAKSLVASGITVNLLAGDMVTFHPLTILPYPALHISIRATLREGQILTSVKTSDLNDHLRLLWANRISNVTFWSTKTKGHYIALINFKAPVGFVSEIGMGKVKLSFERVMDCMVCHSQLHHTKRCPFKEVYPTVQWRQYLGDERTGANGEELMETFN
ncbi:hypothetical protein NP233_g12879 [Leucocoprinus birnbaumii]|uniref:Uncharacterized protein n=1 Tax=Leucocoprinus birnbaumii TaxID=56174 RepID=A0AAD5VDS7_9AGAR|nr:hypothetical protein NP233_g12879 [Leucocoprinus birnbaumii]